VLKWVYAINSGLVFCLIAYTLPDLWLFYNLSFVALGNEIRLSIIDISMIMWYNSLSQKICNFKNLFMEEKVKNIVKRFSQYLIIMVACIATVLVVAKIGKFDSGVMWGLSCVIFLVSAIASIAAEWCCELVEGPKHFYEENRSFLQGVFLLFLAVTMVYTMIEIEKAVSIPYYRIFFFMSVSITIFLIMTRAIQVYAPSAIEKQQQKRFRLWHTILSIIFLIDIVLIIPNYWFVYSKESLLLLTKLIVPACTSWFLLMVTRTSFRKN